MPEDAIDKMLAAIFRMLCADGWSQEVLDMGRSKRSRAGYLAAYRLFMIEKGYPLEEVQRTGIAV